MITYHLNDAQRAFILTWLSDNQKRPSFGAYDKALRKVGKLPTATKPPVKAIPSTKPGFGPGEFVPSSRFNAVKHLPSGWAAFNTHDSGGNHRLINAGEAMLTALWNRWAQDPEAKFSLRGGLVGLSLAKQFAANSIVYPQPSTETDA
jgi:hypothetical protein